jgi:hypothetical protein
VNRSFVSMCVTTVADSPKKMDRLLSEDRFEWAKWYWVSRLPSPLQSESPVLRQKRLEAIRAEKEKM